MDEKERLVRYAYIKNGDVVTQLQRILPITDTIPTSGPDAFISDFLRFVGRQPVLLISCHQQRNSMFQVDNIEARVFPVNTRSCGAFGRIISRILAFFKTLFLFLKFRPDRILCGRPGGMLWATFLVSRLYSIPFVYSSHQNLSTSQHPWYIRPISAIDKWCILSARALVCHGPYLTNQLLEMGAPSDRVFEFDIGFQDMLKELTTTQDIVELSHFTKNMYVLYVGRIETDKGVFDLLYACTQWLRKNHRVKLVYVGDGSQLQRLRKRVRDLRLTDRVIILGEVRHEKVSRIIRKARIVVTPTRSPFREKGVKEAAEARCMAAMEALFVGVPVIASDSGPFPYLIRHGYNGLLFETNSIKALEKTILSVLDDALHGRLRKGAQKSRKDLLNPSLTFSQALERAFSISIKES